MSTHTPGPWLWDSGIVPPDGPLRYSDIYSDDGETIVAHLNDCIPEHAANARLIAAAPDLLDALKQLMEAWPEGEACMGPASAAFDKAYEALAKAEGNG